MSEQDALSEFGVFPEDEDEDVAVERTIRVVAPYSNTLIHSGTPKEKPRLYSQLLGRYVDFNTCICCGETGHAARNPVSGLNCDSDKKVCPMYGRNKGKKNNFHTGGQTTPQQRATRYYNQITY